MNFLLSKSIWTLLFLDSIPNFDSANSFLYSKWIINNSSERNNIYNDFITNFKLQKLNPKIIKVDHHLSHISSSFYCSPFKESAVVSIDGFGDFSSCVFGEFKNNKFNSYNQVYFPHSAGILYQALTQFICFKNYGDEYKLMGLSAYGENRFEKETFYSSG